MKTILDFIIKLNDYFYFTVYIISTKVFHVQKSWAPINTILYVMPLVYGVMLFPLAFAIGEKYAPDSHLSVVINMIIVVFINYLLEKRYNEHADEVIERISRKSITSRIIIIVIYIGVIILPFVALNNMWVIPIDEFIMSILT